MSDPRPEPYVVECTQRELDHARLWLGAFCQLGPSLVVPLRVMWREYRRRPGASADGLRAALELAPWAEVTERRSGGRLRTVVQGVGFRA